MDVVGIIFHCFVLVLEYFLNTFINFFFAVKKE